MKILSHFSTVFIASSLPSKNNAILQINYNSLMKRSIISYKNKLNTFDFPCMYCDGSGYVKCRSCKSGCWKCQETTLEECRYCNGSGKGKFCFNPSTLTSQKLINRLQF